MYIVVDQRPLVTSGYVASFNREGFASAGFRSEDFCEWLQTAADVEVKAVQGFVLGDFASRRACPSMIRSHSHAPIIALSEERSLELTLELLTSGIDDVVRKPVHVREIAARSDAIWRRVNDSNAVVKEGRLKVYLDGRDPEVDTEPLPLPRRERHILEYLYKNRSRRITKAQLFNAIYGIFNDDLGEAVIEGHVSKLRKKLRLKIGYEVIEAKRYIGYRFIG